MPKNHKKQIDGVDYNIINFADFIDNKTIGRKLLILKARLLEKQQQENPCHT